MNRYFYIVEEYNGRKEVHLSGNVYFNDVDETDKCYRLAEWTGFYITVDELKELLENDTFYDYINERVDYLTDLTHEEAVDICDVYFYGSSGVENHIRNVNEDTPCGDYWFE